VNKVRLILVGGFLGAGKTTLLSEVAARLMADGKRVGLITNDQATNLVDTELLAQKGFGVSEVAGGCFCCRFQDLEGAASKLVTELKPDVLLGEPVGSCTDISATVLQPIKFLWTDWISIAPFTVLTDPQRLREALGAAQSDFPDSVMYIFRKQLEEADLIVLNKVDLLSADDIAKLKTAVAERYPGVRVLTMSATTGQGVDEWMKAMLDGGTAGHTVVEVDYDTYAEGEAVLGWLNASISLAAAGGVDWQGFCGDLIGRIRSELAARRAEIAHAKILLNTEAGSIVASATNNTAKPTLRGAIEGSPQEAVLVVNARVNMGPEDLRAVIEETLSAACSKAGVAFEVQAIQNFSPSYPTPVHRYDRVVEAEA